MHRNQYDTDVTTFSPQGRLHQLEYAGEAVKQGSAVVGLRSDNYAVLAALKRSTSDLGSAQQKIFHIDDHMGIGISGLIADARILAKFMRHECLHHRFAMSAPHPVGRLVTKVADKAQYYTQHNSKRPYGVGLLVIGCDKTGPRLFQAEPSGNQFEYIAQGMGTRSQSAKTYLEKHYKDFHNASLDTLIKHALKSLKGTSRDKKKLTTKTVSVSYVGRGENFKILDEEEIMQYFDGLNDDDDDDDDDEEQKEEDEDADSEDGEDTVMKEAAAKKVL